MLFLHRQFVCIQFYFSISFVSSKTFETAALILLKEKASLFHIALHRDRTAESKFPLQFII